MHGAKISLERSELWVSFIMVESGEASNEKSKVRGVGVFDT